jgi:hypothetical protein
MSWVWPFGDTYMKDTEREQVTAMLDALVESYDPDDLGGACDVLIVGSFAATLTVRWISLAQCQQGETLGMWGAEIAVAPFMKCFTLFAFRNDLR